VEGDEDGEEMAVVVVAVVGVVVAASSTSLLSAFLQAFSSPCLSIAVPAFFLVQVGTVHYHSHFDL
jgi:hypothetical protein